MEKRSGQWRREVGDEERGGEEVKRKIFSVQQNNHTVMATFIYELCSITGVAELGGPGGAMAAPKI